ncbi:MAG: MFS transporter [Candidatus Odinarchaeota archaeon]
MSFKDHLQPLFTRQGLLFVSGGMLAGLTWLLHFTIEFSALASVESEPVFILFHLGAVPFGYMFFLLWFSKRDQTISYLFFSTLFTMSLIGLVITREEIIVHLLLAVAGFSLGCVIPQIYIINSRVFTNPEYNGRINYLAFMVVAFCLMLGAILDLYAVMSGDNVIFLIFLGLLLLLLLGSYVIGSNELVYPPRKDLRLYFRKSVLPYPVLLLGFFVGFFYANLYYIVVLMLKDNSTVSASFPYPASLDVFVFVLFFTCALTCPLGGLLYDKIGRRWSILIGFYIEALAFFLIPFFHPGVDEQIMLLFIFPVLAGIGFTLGLFGVFLTGTTELAPKDHLVINSCVFFLFVGFGTFSGVVFDEALKSLIIDQPFMFPVVMIFAYFTATIVVFQLKEPLLSKTELEWRRKIEHVLVLSKSGLPIYSQSLQQQELEADAILAGGALIGISALTNEITRASHLKVIKQEKYCIMLEEGSTIIVAVMVTEELKTIRNRLIDFVADFESFFEDFLVDWTGDTRVFAPTRKLIEKHFV